MSGFASLRSAFFATVALAAPLLVAKTVWVVGEGAPMDVPAVAESLGNMLGDDVTVITNGTTFLSAWVNTPENAKARHEALAAETLFVSPSAREPAELGFLALCALRSQRSSIVAAPLVVAAQKPVYKMSGLCDNRRLTLTARMALGSGCGIVPLPKVWQRVYTDDTFYNGKVPKGPVTEAYVMAAGMTLAAHGADASLPRLPGLHEEVADDLIDSIRKGFAERETVLYAADRQVHGAFDLRVGEAFSAVLYDGAFEHAIGDWLQRLAKADGRKLTLHYTTDTRLHTGLPCLFRTVNALGDAPLATLYTRPAFDDDSGLTELAHLWTILSRDAGKPGWIPFPLAVAEWTRRFPGRPVYDGSVPTQPAAAMFAAMLYLKWTGAAVLPNDIDQTTSAAIGLGLETMLRTRVLRADVNAILCRPLGDQRYAFSLWRRPTQKEVRLYVGVNGASPEELTFDAKDFWIPHPMTFKGPATLMWKIAAETFPGQNTGARALP